MYTKQTKTRPPRPPVLLPTYCRFADLHAAGIVQNWTHLQRLIAEEGFPPGRLLSRNVRAWDVIEEIQPWLRSRPTAPKKIVKPWRRDQLAAEAATKSADT